MARWRTLALGLSTVGAAAWAAWWWAGNSPAPQAAPRPQPALALTAQPSATPSASPAQPTAVPTAQPLATASPAPTASPQPSAAPTQTPSSAATAAPTATPQPKLLQRRQSWRYAVSSSYLLGANLATAELSYQPKGTNYQAQLKVKLAKQTLFDMQAQGRIKATGLEPWQYDEKGLAKDGSVQRQGGDLVWPAHQRRGPLPEGGVLDSVSQHMQLQHELASGLLSTQAGSGRELWLMRPEGLFHWHYAVQGRDTLDIKPLGQVEAVHIVPQALGKGTTQSELWFAPAYDWAPVRIKMRWPDGAWLELNWLP